jgi:hypothetical protein
VHSLCIADQLGVLKSIEHIAKTLHAENQPPPQPYISFPKPRQTSKSQQSIKQTLESVTTEDQNIGGVGTASKIKDTDNQSESQLCDDKSTSPEFLSSDMMETAAASKPSVEGDKSVDLDSKERVDNGTIEIFRNAYYGVGAGTFLF